MSVMTVEAVVEDGQIRLPGDLRLPDRTKVYVVIPGVEAANVARIVSPRLARPEQASDFVLEVIEAEPDAGVRPGMVRSTRPARLRRPSKPG